MVTRKPKEMPSDIVADVSSADILSFAGLVCIQDQYSKSQQGHDKPPPQKPKATKIQKQDPDFEFSYSSIASIAVSPKNSGPLNALVPVSIPYLKQSHFKQINPKCLGM